MRASEEIRRENSKAIQRRDNWRLKYKKIANLIKLYKNEVKYIESRGWTATSQRAILRSLQGDAFGLMIEREWIAEDLKATAYQYE